MTEDNSSSTHPPLPPTTEDDRLARLRLLRSRRVGPATYRRLLAEHGTAARALAALPEMARAAGLPDYRICPEGVVTAEMRQAAQAGAKLVFAGEAGFPAPLSEIEDAPVCLWMIGDPALLQRPMVSVVGSRNASSLGARMARKLAQELGEAGLSVVSGLARGIDAAAHKGALATGTIAVQAGGVDTIYPLENTQLARDIGKQGLRLSDQPMGLQAQARHFPARNRIVAGLGLVTVVVEAAGKSGSLITARLALDQGRDVLAVPGHPFDARASGCNMLIRDGAVLVRNTQDILDHLGNAASVRARAAHPVQPDLPTRQDPPDLAPPAPPARSLRETNLLHQDILARLGPTPMAEDQLIRALGTTSNSVSPLLVELELEGKVIRQAGGLLARTI